MATKHAAAREADRLELLRIARPVGNYWRDVLGQKDWAIWYETVDALPEGSSASCEWSTGYTNARIKLAIDELRRAPDQDSAELFRWLSHTVLHEHIHLTTAELRDLIEKEIGLRTRVGGAIDEGLERLVDRLTAIFMTIAPPAPDISIETTDTKYF
jgi:hypothetical protein